jgi:hypothetical protein
VPVAAAAGGAQTMEASQVLVLPVHDMPAGTGFWLIERDQGRVYASRIARRPDGHFVATEVQTVSQGAASGAQLVLTRQLGPRGPHAVVSWGRGESAPRVEVVDGRSAGTAGAGGHLGGREDAGPSQPATAARGEGQGQAWQAGGRTGGRELRATPAARGGGAHVLHGEDSESAATVAPAVP